MNRGERNTQKIPITPEIARLCIRYLDKTGTLFWRWRPASLFTNARVYKRWNREHAFRAVKLGQDRDGYPCFSLLGNNVRASRIAWICGTGTMPSGRIRTRGDRTDLRLINLYDDGDSPSRPENMENA